MSEALAEIVKEAAPIPQVAPAQKMDPSAALANMAGACRMARLTADEHELISLSFDRLAELIPGGFVPPVGSQKK